MKIVIDISDRLFEVIKKSGSGAPKVIDDAILNGTPLPKNHGELIDKNELIKRYEKSYDDGGDLSLGTIIERVPTIIEAESEDTE